MPDPSLPPTSDDDSEDLSAFDEFVNRHLDFDAKPPPSVKKSDDGLFEDDSDEEEDPFGRIRPPTPQAPIGGLFGARSTFGSPSRTPGPQPGGAGPGAASLPPRIPMPAPDDRRWQQGVYSVKGDLEIFYSQPFIAMRVLVIPEANRRWNKKVRYIPNIAPGWAAFEIRTARLVRGFVRQSDVRLTPIPKSPAWSSLFGIGPLKLDWLDLVVVGVVLLMLLFILTDIDDNLFYVPRPHIEALQQQIATQQAQIDALEAKIGRTPVRLPFDQ